MDDISFNIACKELKIAQIAQLNQLFQLLHLVQIYGHGFYELSRMLVRKNVNNDVSKDSPIVKHRFKPLIWVVLFTGVIPKSVSTQHIKDNICVTDFELSTEDMETLNQMNNNTHFCWDPTGVKWHWIKTIHNDRFILYNG